MLQPIILDECALDFLDDCSPDIALASLGAFIAICLRHAVVVDSEKQLEVLKSKTQSSPFEPLWKMFIKQLSESRLRAVDVGDITPVVVSDTTELRSNRVTVRDFHLSTLIQTAQELGHSSIVAMSSAMEREIYWTAWLLPLVRSYSKLSVFDKYALDERGITTLTWLVDACSHASATYSSKSGNPFRIDVFCEELDCVPDLTAVAEKLKRQVARDSLTCIELSIHTLDKFSDKFIQMAKGHGAIINQHNRHMMFSGGCNRACAIMLEEGIAFLSPRKRGHWNNEVNHHYVSGRSETDPLIERQNLVLSGSTHKVGSVRIT